MLLDNVDLRIVNAWQIVYSSGKVLLLVSLFFTICVLKLGVDLLAPVQVVVLIYVVYSWYDYCNFLLREKRGQVYLHTSLVDFRILM